MLQRKNPKKIISSCQLKKDGYTVVRSECPAIKSVRNIRKKLNKLVKEQADGERIETMRRALKNAKTSEARQNQCKHCYHAQRIAAKA